MREERSEGVTGADMAEAFLRTVTHDLTSEGTPAPPDWSSMFAVLIQGPAFVPADFESNVPGKVSTSGLGLTSNHMLRLIGGSTLVLGGFLSRREAGWGPRHSTYSFSLLHSFCFLHLYSFRSQSFHARIILKV